MARKKVEKTTESVDIDTVENDIKRYSKQDILTSNQFDDIEKDFLYACLPEGLYTVEEARKKLEKYLKEVIK